jgi:hypothetical protein
MVRLRYFAQVSSNRRVIWYCLSTTSWASPAAISASQFVDRYGMLLEVYTVRVLAQQWLKFARCPSLIVSFENEAKI